MSSTLFLSMMLAASADMVAVTPENYPKISHELLTSSESGSLIFSQGDCLAVKLFSGSPYTHVGVVVRQAGQHWVYDSMSGVGVRKTPLEEYVLLQTPCTLHVIHPQKPFDVDETAALADYLESQLGRHYSVKHHLTGCEAEGIHCAEYAVSGFMAANRLKADRPAKVSPGSLLVGVQEAGQARDGGTFLLSPAPIAVEARGWWSQLWLDTKTCTGDCCQQMRRWFVCS